MTNALGQMVLVQLSLVSTVAKSQKFLNAVMQ